MKTNKLWLGLAFVFGFAITSQAGVVTETSSSPDVPLTPSAVNCDATGTLEFDDPTFVIDCDENEIEVEVVATKISQHALEINMDAAGFGNVSAIDIKYDTGAQAATDEDAIILININELDSNSGHIIGLQVLSTGGGSDEVHVIHAGANVAPIDHESGGLGNLDIARVVDTDRTTEFNSTSSDIVMFETDNSSVTVGSLSKFTQIQFVLATVASGGGIAPTFEYSTSQDNWASFVPIDGTDGMKITGIIAFELDLISDWAVGLNNHFLIRIIRTRNTLATAPIEDQVQISATTEYSKVGAMPPPLATVAKTN